MSAAHKGDHRGWLISDDVNGYGHHGSHPDYDGPEDNRHVHGWTIDQVKDEIDIFLEEHPEQEPT